MVVDYLGKGIAHERAGMPCQDAVYGCRAQNGNMILVLSDGASSARRGGIASRSVVDTITEFFRRMSLAEFLALPEECRSKRLLEVCNAQLRKLAKAMGEPDLRHFSATLVFSVLADEKILMGHLGDGMALVLDTAGEIIMYSAPDRGSGGENATWFVVSPAAEQHLRLRVLERDVEQLGLLALTSDGPMEMLAGRGDSDPVETIKELLGYIRSGDLRSNDDLADILNQMAEITEERMDDWSMILWSPAEDFEEFPLGRVCRCMLWEEEEKYGINASG